MHTGRVYKCGLWAVRLKHFKDREVPLEIRNLCTKVPRKRLGIGLLGSGANVQHATHVGLNQPDEAPTQTVERLKKALLTLQEH